MLFNRKTEFKLFSNVENPNYIVFCDFDETYYPHTMTEDRQRDLYELEDYLDQKSKDGVIIVGWVTGSSMESILDKMERGKFRFFPHFIASDLGTEITYFSEQNFGEQDKEWHSRIKNEEFTEEKIEKIINHLHAENSILLNPQTQLGSSRYKRNYYYQERNEEADKQNLLIIETIGKQHGVAVNINRCNPLAGDPEDSFDVDFIPVGTGKDEIVRFMLEKYNLKREDAFAFGDSGNDLRMLQTVKHGYLVENATEEAKNAHAKIAAGPYSEGIISTLKSVIEL
ncbi:HAD-IIB family hydrolase [Metabacillus fastidiosus]|uniref:HAD-IIB family hydrolase n=1 Tax=Metabacillus fastidiosus TaxID=1458 RepID=UPI002DB5FB08|nr:HAD-IIB family hydrolase [Metabacillus fastidiosus]MEC2078341.1 HAD-IIB family hydrolase [Metabacillus fastidiosus]